MYAKNPLEVEDRLANRSLNIPVSFFYGDRDWMDFRGGQRVIENNKFYNSADPDQGLCHVHIVTNSDHHLYLDNPNEFAQLLILDI